MSDRAVVFDCDGVLVDSEVIAIEIEVAALNAVGVPLDAAGLAARYVGVSRAAQSRMVAEEFDVDLDDSWWAELFARAEQALFDRVAPVAGIRAVVEGLDVPYVLASSSRHARIEGSLRTAGLLDLFPAGIRFSAEDVQRGKPAPDLFLHAAAAIGVDPAGCTVVEDSPYGVQAAVAAGMDVIGFTGGGHTDDGWALRLGAAGAQVVVTDAASLALMLA